MSLVEENLWIAQCLESAALVNDQTSTRDVIEHDESKISLSSYVNVGQGNGQGESVDSFWNDA